MARDFIGRGWKFPVEVDRSGGIGTADLDDLITQSIHIILGTAPGERVMRPYFGCAIHELLFAPNNLSTATLAAHFAEEALSKWEPRISSVEAIAKPSADEQNRLDITINYRVRATNQSRNLVYPFYIRRNEDQ